MLNRKTQNYNSIRQIADKIIGEMFEMCETFEA
jgi:hypothetical protein